MGVKNGFITKKGGLIQIIAINPTAMKKLYRKMLGSARWGSDLPKEFKRRYYLAEIDENFIKKDALTNNSQVDDDPTLIDDIKQHTAIYNNDKNVERNNQRRSDFSINSYSLYS